MHSTIWMGAGIAVLTATGIGLSMLLCVHMRDVRRRLPDWDTLRAEWQRHHDQHWQQSQVQFGTLVERLTVIDSAQQRMVELSSGVTALHDLLRNKSARGAFGESQLHTLVADILPTHTYQMQYTLPTGHRADCALFLPEPTGMLLVDAKFPLEAYQRMHAENTLPADRKNHARQFRLDVKKHIQDVAEKYIVPGITSEGAILFLPAESLFAEIHTHFPELVQEAQKKRVWLTSPNTLLAILTTAQTVWKHARIQAEAHIIHEQLGALSAEFARFCKRIADLESHIKKAAKDTDGIHISARKISERFQQIQLEVPQETRYRNAPEAITDPE